MRHAKSYSIIDHQLLHGGYLHKLSHQALVLYLFLVVVGDKEGKSFYGEDSIIRILRFRPDQFFSILSELTGSNLIEYRRPYFWVKNLNIAPQADHRVRPVKRANINPRSDLGRSHAITRKQDNWQSARQGIQNLLKQLGSKC